MAGVVAQPEGITQPPIDELLDRVDSKYALVVYAAKRARQINTYNQQIADGMFSTPGPLVPVSPDDKPLSIALREIQEDLLTFKHKDEVADEQAGAEPEIEIDPLGSADMSLSDSLELPTDFGADFN